MIEEAVIYLIFFIILYILYNQNPSDYPPGPFKIPIIGGGLPNNDRRCVKLQKKYGDMIMEKVGKYYWLTICDYNIGKEAFSKTQVAYRPEIDMFRKLSGGEAKGIFSTNGIHAKSNRRFLLHHLRDSGMGKPFIENSIQDQAKNLINEFNRLSGLTTNLTFVNFAPLNVVWQIFASKMYSVNDPMLDTVQRMNQEFTKSLGPMLILELIPALNYILPDSFINYFMKRNDFDIFFEELRRIAQAIIGDHKENFDPSNPKDIIDMYFLEEENPRFLLKENMSESDLRAIGTDLFNAGTDTVSISLRWTIYYMAKYPEIQLKMQKEIDSVVPRNVLPGYEHKSRLPYCDAVIHESLRKTSLGNFGCIHICNEEIFLGGYRIPKDTLITIAHFFIHHDPRYWRNPEEFNPERFLNENGKFSPPTEGFLPFGTGKRQCPGEGLARAELYLYIAAIFQNFFFSAPNGKDIDLGFSNENFGMHTPIIQDVLITARN